MKLLFLSLLFSPAFLYAQINRSANEFGREKIEAYITTKLFKDQAYKPLSFEEIKPYTEVNRGYAWKIAHHFEITEYQVEGHGYKAVQRPYHFTFYFNDRMKVIRADMSYVD